MIYINSQTCTGCSVCQETCPENAIVLHDTVAHIEEGICNDCELCLDACPQGAILCVDLMTNESASAVPVPQTMIVPIKDEMELASNRPALLIRALPAIGSALIWAGREILPYVAPLALDLLDQRRQGRSAGRVTSPAQEARPQGRANRAVRLRRHRRCRGGRQNRNKNNNEMIIERR